MKLTLVPVVALLAAVWIGWQCQQPKNRENRTMNRLESFKSEIGFQTLSEKTQPYQPILLTATSLAGLGMVSLADWTPLSNIVYQMDDNCVIRIWDLEHDSVTATLSLIVSSAGQEAARQALLSIASNTSSPSIPFIKGPDDLGDLAIEYPEDDELQDIVWTHGNYCARVGIEDGDHETALRLARDLEKCLAGYGVSDLTTHLIRIDSVDLKSASVKVSEPFEIAANVSAPDINRIKMECVSLQGRLEIQDLSDRSATVLPIQKGSDVLVVRAFDTLTLLCASRRIELKITDQ